LSTDVEEVLESGDVDAVSDVLLSAKLARATDILVRTCINEG